MPRPGPRPYECVRRAWHSDRHQPIRGSLIREIFRVVNEIHSSATKKNKEWQVKLPVVVLKAEEIMYSKANSEAEYMDLKTLRDRINDAINTIIRRDESTEAGELLQPCIEAALNLGCTPRRASRSQRNTNPRCYLSPGAQDPSTSNHGNVNSSLEVNHINNSQFIPNCLSFIQPRVSSCANSVSGSKNVACDDNKLTSDKVFIAPDNVLLPTKNKSLHMEKHPESSSYLVYPLYYGSCLEPERGVGVLPNSVSSTAEPVKVGVIHNLLSCHKKVPGEASEVDVKNSPLDQHETECDLSLRLGSVSASSLSVENNRLQKVEDVGCGSSQEGSKFNDRMQQVDKDFKFCSSVNVGDPLNSSSGKLSEHMNADLRAKKRRAAFGHLDEDQPFWQARLPSNQLTVRMKSAGS